MVLHTAEIRADLLRRQDDGIWPADPLLLAAGDVVELESIALAAPLVAFYRTSGLPA
jgi:hypothetical protein